jgi:sugar fermentation stimulation protein A
MIERPGPGRKTGYDLALVDLDGQWVSVDARLPNDLLGEALRALDGGASAAVLEPFAGYETVRREVPFGSSRFDFSLEARGRPPFLVEVKSITLVLDGLGCFPDAVTARGKRHLEELTEALGAGYRAAVVFVVQRADARGVRPHDDADPKFGQALRRAAGQGVEVYAYGCRVSPKRVTIERCLPVHLD